VASGAEEGEEEGPQAPDAAVEVESKETTVAA